MHRMDRTVGSGTIRPYKEIWSMNSIHKRRAKRVLTVVVQEKRYVEYVTTVAGQIIHGLLY